LDSMKNIGHSKFMINVVYLFIGSGANEKLLELFVSSGS
jgi:hypothetical protein